MSVIQSIIKHEGFRSRPYPDPVKGWSVPTFGHGLTYITEDESRLLLQSRVTEIIQKLHERINIYSDLPLAAQEILIEMAYQMGVSGVLGFKQMLKALAKRDFKEASMAMLDSKWAVQTPQRARELATRMYKIGD